ncbi:MAG: hypothetical protein P8Y99_08970 [Calditrichaceae bacterium]
MAIYIMNLPQSNKLNPQKIYINFIDAHLDVAILSEAIKSTKGLHLTKFAMVVEQQ